MRVRADLPGRSALLVVGSGSSGCSQLAACSRSRHVRMPPAELRCDRTAQDRAGWSRSQFRAVRLSLGRRRPAQTAGSSHRRNPPITTLRQLAVLGHSDEPARILTTSRRYFALVDHLLPSSRGARRRRPPVARSQPAPGRIQFQLEADLVRRNSAMAQMRRARASSPRSRPSPRPSS